MEETPSPAQALVARINDIFAPVRELKLSESMDDATKAAVVQALEQASAALRKDVVPPLMEAKDRPDLADARDAAAIAYRQLAILNSWLDRDEVTLDWLHKARALAVNAELKITIAEEERRVQNSRDFGDIFEMCRDGRIAQAKRAFEERRAQAQDPAVQARIDELVRNPRTFAKPIKSAPSMTTLNGIGTALWGERDRDPRDGTYVSTLCFVVLFMPLIPISAYLVKRAEEGWIFLGKVPLSPFATWWRRAILLGPALLIAINVALSAYENSPSVRESRDLAAAEEALGQGRFLQSFEALARAAGTKDAGRRARMTELARRALVQQMDALKTPALATGFVGGTGVRLKALRPLTRDWYAPDVLDAVERAAERVGGAAARDLVEWACVVAPECESRRLPLIVRLAGGGDPALLAAAARWHARAGKPCPADLVRRLGERLAKERHDGWDEDALSYLSVADAAEARPVLLLRAEAAWKGAADGASLATIRDRLPAALRALLEADALADDEKRVAALEPIAEGDGLGDPERAWHRLGVARRLSDAYARLNDRDPVRFPIARAVPWIVRASELSPKDVPLRATALRRLVEAGEFERAVSLGAAENDAASSAYVGIAHSRLGRLEEAERVLAPVVASELPPYVAAGTELIKREADLTRRLIDSLKNGTADRATLIRLGALHGEALDRAVTAWLRERVEADPAVRRLSETLRGRAHVHPAATELAMTLLSSGRRLPAGEARQAKLKEAERIFLELRRVSEDDPHQELQLAQVYIWMGREAEGQAIFDKFEKSGDGHVLLQMAHATREMGRMDAARRLAEASYEKLPADQRSAAAVLRELLATDEEDKLAWLNKADTTNPFVKTELTQLRGSRLIEEGKHAEAMALLRQVASYYAARSETDSTLNNGAMVQLEMYQATGDPSHVKEAQRLMRRAAELAKDNALILGNYVRVLRYVGYLQLAGDAVRADLAHAMPSRDWMELALPRRRRAEWAEAVRAQVELRRAAELGARVSVLASEDDDGWDAQVDYLWLTRDAAGLKLLRESLEASPPSRAEAEAEARSGGTLTDARKRAQVRLLARLAAELPAVRAAGHAPTLSFALARQSTSILVAHRAAVEGASLDEAVKAAEEAARLSPARHARAALMAALGERASRTLAEKDARYKAWVASSQGAHACALLWLYVERHADARKAVRELADVWACAEAAKAVDDPELAEWMWLDLAGAEAAEAARRALVGEGLALELRRVRWRLHAQSVAATIEAYACARAFGDGALAERVAAEGRARRLVGFGE